MVPVFLSKQLIVFQTHLLGKLARDVSRAKNDVPNEQEVAKVALVMTHAIFLRNGMVRPVGCRCGNGSFQNPHQGSQDANFVKRLVPTPSAVGTHDDAQFDHHVQGIHHATDTHEKQNTCKPQARHHEVIKEIIAIGDANAHVRSRVMRTV